MIIIKILKNKYFLTIIALVVWLIFFDKNDVSSQYSLIKKLQKLNTEKEYYIQEIENNTREINELQTNTKSLEKFAREKYLMKKDNEDIFIIVQK